MSMGEGEGVAECSKTEGAAAGTWRRSSYSYPENDCVEVRGAAGIQVRDSRGPAHHMLELPRSAWADAVRTWSRSAS